MELMKLYLVNVYYCVISCVIIYQVINLFVKCICRLKNELLIIFQLIDVRLLKQANTLGFACFVNNRYNLIVLIKHDIVFICIDCLLHVLFHKI